MKARREASGGTAHTQAGNVVGERLAVDVPAVHVCVMEVGVALTSPLAALHRRRMRVPAGMVAGAVTPPNRAVNVHVCDVTAQVGKEANRGPSRHVRGGERGVDPQRSEHDAPTAKEERQVPSAPELVVGASTVQGLWMHVASREALATMAELNG